MKKSLVAIFASLAFVLLTGCSTVTSTALVGQPNAAGAKALDGVWKIGDSVVFLRSTGNGELQMAAVEWKDGKWQVQPHTVVVTQLGKDNYYANVVDDSNKTPPTRYSFARLMLDGDKPNHIVVTMPDVQNFDNAVKNGTLQGTSQRSAPDKPVTQVNLTASAKDFQAYILKGSVEELFDLKHPIILTRLSAPQN